MRCQDYTKDSAQERASIFTAACAIVKMAFLFCGHCGGREIHRHAHSAALPKCSVISASMASFKSMPDPRRRMASRLMPSKLGNSQLALGCEFWFSFIGESPVFIDGWRSNHYLTRFPFQIFTRLGTGTQKRPYSWSEIGPSSAPEGSGVLTWARFRSIWFQCKRH